MEDKLDKKLNRYISYFTRESDKVGHSFLQPICNSTSIKATTKKPDLLNCFKRRNKVSMSMSLIYFGVSEKEETLLIRKKLENFIKTNFRLIDEQSIYYDLTDKNNPNRLVIDTADYEVTVNGERYTVDQPVHIDFEESADVDFSLNYYGFSSSKKIIAQNGLVVKVNYLFEVSAFTISPGLRKLGLDIMKKLIELSDGYLCVGHVDTTLVEKYQDDIHFAVDDSEPGFTFSLYLVSSYALNEIYKSENELFIFLMNIEK